jgi:hypothetical protein
LLRAKSIRLRWDCRQVVAVLAGDFMKRVKERLSGSEVSLVKDIEERKQQRMKGYKNLGVVSSDIEKWR